VLKQINKTMVNIIHKNWALKDDKLGQVYYWAFNDSYIFLNFEKEKTEHLKNIDQIKVLSKEEGSKLWEERNVKSIGKDGKEHDKLTGAALRLRGTTDKTGKWTMDFCSEIGSVYGAVTMFERLVAMYNKRGLKKLQKKPAFKALAYKFLFMNEVSNRAYDEELNEDEILKIVGKYKSLPKDWRMIKIKSKESKHYMKIADEVELKIEITSEEEKEKILTAEETLSRNAKEETLKIEYNGHAPYDDAHRSIKREIEKRDDEGHDDVKIAKKLVGTKIHLDGTGCYYCGNKLGLYIKDENTVEYFMWEHGENYRHKNEIPGICEMKDKKSRTNEFELNFPTGEVIVDNYFLDKDGEYMFDVPKDEQYSDKYTLQTLKGRFNRQNYIAKTHNAGYAQMGNMDMHVFVSKDKKTLIFGHEPFEWNENAADNKFNKKFEKEYTKLGEVSLSVWRWECADKKTLADAGHSGEGEVVAKVIPGTWKVKHLYGSVACEKNTHRYMTYSKLTLKNNE